MHLSQHFSLEEFQKTSKKLDNTIPDSMIVKAIYLAGRMEIVRRLLGNFPIQINSAYRSPEVNRAVGGVPTSQHAKLEAIDFVVPKYGSPYEVAKFLSSKVGELNYDQLIYEQTWVHISFVADRVPRNQNLTYFKGKYAKGITK